MCASFVLRLLVLGAKRVQLFRVPFFMLSLFHISPLGKLFPVPEQSIVIFYISLNPILANSCVTLTNGLEMWSAVGIAPTPAMSAAIPQKCGNKLSWYSLFSLLEGRFPFVLNKFLCVICDTCTVFGNSCLKWMFSWLFFSIHLNYICRRLL